MTKIIIAFELFTNILDICHIQGFFFNILMVFYGVFMASRRYTIHSSSTIRTVGHMARLSMLMHIF